MTPEKLRDKGYAVLPISPNSKVPCITEWQIADSDELIATGWPSDRHGIGIRCGDYYVAGLDVDIYDAEIIQKMKEFILMKIGSYVSRVGMAPKTLIPVVCHELTGKKVSKRFRNPTDNTINAMEVLSVGNQFICEGTHPDTLMPYEWDVNEMPHRDDLPVVTLAQIQEMFDYFEMLALAKGWVEIVKPKSVNKKSQTPQEHRYNSLYNVTDLLVQYGWKQCGEGSEWWTRPGKHSGVSGTVTENTFYCFTSSSMLQPEMTHRPYDIVLAHAFNGDQQVMDAHVQEVTLSHAAQVFANPPTALPDDIGPTPIAEAAPSIWENPISIDTPVLPSVTQGMMPTVLENMVFSISANTETPPELATMFCLTVSATACQKKYVVESTFGHTEQLSLWGIAALESGNRKSAVEKMAVGPLRKWESDKRKSLEPKVEEATVRRDNEQVVIKGLKKKLLNGKLADRERIKTEIFALEQELTEIPKPPQIWEQDITPEHLGTVMNDNNECMGLFSSEGGIFDTIGGRYSKGVPNMDLFLQSHSGDSVRVSRGSRPPVNLTAPALSMGISPQPSVLKSLADSPGFRGRGFIARFMWLLPISPLGSRQLIDVPPINVLVTNYYSLAIQKLLNKPYPEFEPEVIKMSSEASGLWNAFSLQVENDLLEGGRFEHIKDWAGKLPGLIARIAGVYHCVAPDGNDISRATMGMALKFTDVLIPHALAAFDLMGSDEGMSGARKILNWITRNNHTEFTARDCFQSTRRTFGKTTVMQESLDVLKEHYIIRELRREVKKTGRPSSTKYEVNPRCRT